MTPKQINIAEIENGWLVQYNDALAEQAMGKTRAFLTVEDLCTWLRNHTKGIAA